MVGTPGRVLDNIYRSVLKVDKITLLILEELDRLMDMGFLNQIREIATQLAPYCQCVATTSELSTELIATCQKFMQNSVTITYRSSLAEDSISHYFIPIDKEMDKPDKLLALLLRFEEFPTVIYVSNNSTTE